MTAVSQELEIASKVLKSHAIKDLGPIIESSKEFKTLLPLYHSVCEVNDAATEKYNEILKKGVESVTGVNQSRVETIINATLSEVDHYHEEKQRQWTKNMTNYIEGMIATHQAVCF